MIDAAGAPRRWVKSWLLNSLRQFFECDGLGYRCARGRRQRSPFLAKTRSRLPGSRPKGKSPLRHETSRPVNTSRFQIFPPDARVLNSARGESIRQLRAGPAAARRKQLAKRAGCIVNTSAESSAASANLSLANLLFLARGLDIAAGNLLMDFTKSRLGALPVRPWRSAARYSWPACVPNARTKCV